MAKNARPADHADGVADGAMFPSFHAERSEIALVGGMLHRDPLARSVAARHGITGRHFVAPALRRVFEEIVSADADGKPITPEAIWDRIGEDAQRKLPWPDLFGLFNDGTLTPEEECANLRSCLIRSDLYFACRAAMSEILNTYDGDDAAAKVMELVAAAAVEHRFTSREKGLAIALDVLDEDQAAVASGNMIGARTGLAALDNDLSGLEPGRVYIVGAHSSVGKTAFALQTAWINARDRSLDDAWGPVLFASSEMSNRELMRRVLIAARRGTNPRHEPTRARQEAALDLMGQAVEDIVPLQWEFVEAVGAPIAAVEAEVAGMVAETGKPPRLLVVDYVQHFGTPDGVDASSNTAALVRDVSRRLKVIARKYGMPVLATSQIRRPAGSGDNPPKPTAHDLFESSAILNNADAVLMLHRRPGGDKDERAKWATPVQDRLRYHLYLVKNRSGKLTNFVTSFNPVWGILGDVESELTAEGAAAAPTLADAATTTEEAAF